MRVVRPLVGLSAGTAGAAGLVLCVAGLVGLWTVYTEVVRRVDRVFGGADRALADVQGNLRAAAGRLRETEAELEAARKREADLAAQPPAERGPRRERSRKAVEALGPEVREARATLVKATEAALVANGLLEALAELPGVERVNVDTDQLEEASDRLSDLTGRANRLAELLARAGPADDDQVGGESSRAIELVRRTTGPADAGSDRLEVARQKVAAAHARLMRWIDGVALALAVVLVWIGAGQLSLMVHGWKLVRGPRRAPAPAPGGPAV